MECGKQYYEENPSEGGYDKAKKEWEKICKNYKKGELEWNSSYTSYGEHYYEIFEDFDTYLNSHVYTKKGHGIIAKNTTELMKKLKEYPNDYIGTCYVLCDMDPGVFDDVLYDDSFAGDTPIAVLDLRDDRNNPNIISNYKYYYYVIFTGTHRGSNGLVLDFNLISLEKISE